MGRIRILDDRLVNRIAAGEVVERPAAVVKELIENSLDASARRIDISLVGAGTRLIRVEDDGEGMDRDDALLALERHATSKLRALEDLEGISTLGFRGEALPSIAAVSRFVLRTAVSGGVGTEIEVRGGRILGVREVGVPRGTTVEVASLFFNTPARRKFLKSPTTELAHILRTITRLALTRPDLSLRCVQEGRAILEFPATADLAERIAQAYGSQVRRGLLPLEARGDGIRIHGFVGRPAEASSRRDTQHLFVNGRAVQDRVLSHAVSEAYGNTVPRDRHPAIFLFLELEPALVDVNVHPQKTEVRFAQASRTHDATRDAIAACLGTGAAIPERTPSAAPGAARAVLRYLELNERVLGWTRTEGSSVRDGASLSPRRLAEPGPSAATPAERAVPTAVALSQYLDSYIIAQDPDGLLLVDQHAAHERVLYERFLAQAEQNRLEVQRLLFPVVLELSPQERVILEREAAEFARLGFALEPFGADAARLESIPALAAGRDPAELVRALLGEAARARAAACDVAELRHKLVTTAACHAAIKIRHRLTIEGMQALLDDVFRAANPTTCPHGRPLVFRLTLAEIEKAFHRR